MIAHYSYVEENGLTSYYDKIDSLYNVTVSLSNLERIHLYDSVSSIYNNDYTFTKVSDLHVITANYLINIFTFLSFYGKKVNGRNM